MDAFVVAIFLALGIIFLVLKLLGSYLEKRIGKKEYHRDVLPWINRAASHIASVQKSGSIFILTSALLMAFGKKLKVARKEKTWYTSYLTRDCFAV